MALSGDLWEKLIFLAATGVLLRLLIPLIIKRVDEGRAIRKKRLEAEISRQTKVIEAQSKLLDATTKNLWTWRYLVMKVAVTGLGGREKKYAEAVTKYEADIWNVLSRMRNHASRSRRLVSERGYLSLRALYLEIVELGARLDHIIQTKPAPEERADAWGPIHEEIFSKMTDKLDQVLAQLAQEAQLTASQAKNADTTFLHRWRVGVRNAFSLPNGRSFRATPRGGAREDPCA